MDLRRLHSFVVVAQELSFRGAARRLRMSQPPLLHTLRKEYGSPLTRNFGIHAASRALRHAALRTTSEHYSDSAARVTSGIGRLLRTRESLWVLVEGY